MSVPCGFFLYANKRMGHNTTTRMTEQRRRSAHRRFQHTERMVAARVRAGGRLGADMVPDETWGALPVWETGVATPADCYHCPEPPRSDQVLRPPTVPRTSQCEDGKVRAYCKRCKARGTGGEMLCDAHRVRKVLCHLCKLPGHGTQVCEHSWIRAQCARCKAAGNGGGWLLCAKHFRLHNRCQACRADEARAEVERAAVAHYMRLASTNARRQ